MNTDRPVNMIVAFMGSSALSVILGGIWLAAHGSSLPDALIALGGVALGNLGTFLVSTRGAGEPPQEVQVVNQPDAPVPVDTTQPVNLP